ncbi:hypothetical protein KQX54_013043 [Cotesia glomerata]|uniref:Uncharacterized protein n=1 Tax=Cotesia glomerata TaxID=32391 RepID=A0AAV7HTQ2_COTGL|nr:hypothetical protein KQX54_013043 [Cotesia glomerata]
MLAVRWTVWFTVKLRKADNPNKAYFKLCKSELRAHRTDLVRHRDSAKHIKNATATAAHVTINRVFSKYLGLIPVVETSANDLYEALNKYFIKINLNLSNGFAIATDGGSNLCGIRHSLFTLMKEKNEKLILFKCICHSIHLVCFHASEELPSNIDYMLREIFKWFKRSALRRKKYLHVYNTINDEGDPLQLVQLSGTRWLARGQAVALILDQWDSLKLHFDVAASEKHQDRYTAKEFQEMYNDPANLLYFTFLSPILSKFNSINLLFQKEHADHFAILQE